LPPDLLRAALEQGASQSAPADVELIPTTSNQARRLAWLRGPDRWWKLPVAHAIACPERFDIPRLEETFLLLARRHRSLRTFFRPDDPIDAAACLRAEDAGWPLEVVLPSPGEDTEETLGRAFERLLEPFDPYRPPLCRALLLRRPGEDDLLGLSVDHVVYDGYSAAVLLADLAAVYDALGAGTPLRDGLPGDSAWFAAEERRWLVSDEGRAAYRYWVARYSGIDGLPRLALPYEEVSGPTRSALHGIRLSQEDVGVMRRRMADLRVSEFMLVAAATSHTLRDHAPADRVEIMFSNSRRRWRSSRNIVGYLANRSLLSLDIGRDQSVASTALEVRTAIGQSVRHSMLSHDHFTRVHFPDSYARKPTVPHLFLNVARQRPVPSIGGAPCVAVPVPAPLDDADPPGLRIVLTFRLDGTALLLCEYLDGTYPPDLVEGLTQTIARRCVAES
jgi:hypothetical protein